MIKEAIYPVVALQSFTRITIKVLPTLLKVHIWAIFVHGWCYFIGYYFHGYIGINHLRDAPFDRGREHGSWGRAIFCKIRGTVFRPTQPSYTQSPRPSFAFNSFFGLQYVCLKWIFYILFLPDLPPPPPMNGPLVVLLQALVGLHSCMLVACHKSLDNSQDNWKFTIVWASNHVNDNTIGYIDCYSERDWN